MCEQFHKNACLKLLSHAEQIAPYEQPLGLVHMVRYFVNVTVFLSHAMGFVDGYDTVHLVRLPWIFVCDILHACVVCPLYAIAMCDSKYTYIHTNHSHTM